MIKPTVGRIVWFWSSISNKNAEMPPLAAIVTNVHSDEMVDLCIFSQNGNPNPQTSVPLVQPETEHPKTGMFCEWMPYQIGQAKK